MRGHSNLFVAHRGGRSIPRGLRLSGNFRATAPTRTHIQTDQERTLLRRLDALQTLGLKAHVQPLGARTRVFLGWDLRKPKTPYPSVPEALAAEAATEGAFTGVATGLGSACAPCGIARPITTVEMACLKMSCSCPLFSAEEMLSYQSSLTTSFRELRFNIAPRTAWAIWLL